MNCFECARVDDAVAAVSICRHCGVGLCLDHLIEARDYEVGGTNFGCQHELPAAKPLSGVPAAIAEAAEQHTASVG
jgi:hypothetical protein